MEQQQAWSINFKMTLEDSGEYSFDDSTGKRVVKSAFRGSRAVATVVVGGLAMAFGSKERQK